MVVRDRIPLHDARLELTRHLSEDERRELATLSLPIVTAEAGPIELDELLSRHRAFGATVFDGIVINALRLGDQTGIQLLGPGDVLVSRSDLWPTWMTELELRLAAPAQLCLLGDELLAAVYRWPRVIQGLYASLADQLQRLTAQLVICQLPRVEDRLLAMLWLLSETWGQVTTSGTRLPLTLTHETLGAMIGARRPTVSLALRRLAEEGAVIHQDSGWLLLQPPPEPAGGAPRILPTELAEVTPTGWAIPESPHDPSIAYAELRDVVRDLRDQHRLQRERTREQLEQIRSARVRMAGVREQIAEEALRRRWPPSS